MALAFMQGQELYVAGNGSRIPSTVLLDLGVYPVHADQDHSRLGTQLRCLQLGAFSVRADPHKSPFMCTLALKYLR